MTQPGAELAQPERPRRLLKLVPSVGLYAVPQRDTAPSGAAPVRIGASRPAASTVQTDPFTLSWEAAEAVSESVVAVAVTNSQRGSQTGSQRSSQRGYQRGHRRGRGVGVIFDTEGHILTRYCVVAGTRQGSTILVTLKDKRVFEAKVVGTDPSTDLALIKLTNAPEGLRAVALDDVRGFRVGGPTAS